MSLPMLQRKYELGTLRERMISYLTPNPHLQRWQSVKRPFRAVFLEFCHCIPLFSPLIVEGVGQLRQQLDSLQRD